jgi:hypothetical protein
MLYFIKSGQFIKVGLSNQPWQRLNDLQTANPEPLEMLVILPGDQAFEGELHRLFGEYHHRGEWFRENPKFTEWVAFMRRQFPELQAPPASQGQGDEVKSVETVMTTKDDGDTEWRIERRTYVKKDGSVSTYHNYRRRKIDRDPLTGKQRIEYRPAGDLTELPCGDMSEVELTGLNADGWRTEIFTNRNGLRYWQWRRRGPVRDCRYGGRLLESTP